MPAPAPRQKFTELKQKIAELRGLPFRREVSLNSAAAEATNPGPGKTYAVPDGGASVDRLSRIYQRLGLLPEATDFVKALADYSRLEAIAAYRPETEGIVVTAEAARLGRVLAGESSAKSEEIAAAFALTDALQEQHFDWHQKTRTISPEDRRLALRAVAQGDAVLVGWNYLGQGKKPPSREEQAQAIGRLSGELEKMAAGLPELLKRKWVFPYIEGSQFVWWAYATKGWEGVNRLFAEPPISTSQVLHPEKYYLRREEPQRIVPWGLMRQIKTAPVLEQRLGEALIQVALLSRYSRKQSAEIASGWKSDHLWVYEADPNLIIAWLSVWSDEENALRFFRSYRDVLERQHRVRFEPTGAGGRLHAETAAGGWTVLQTEGPIVLLLDGLTLPRARELADEIWRDLDVGTPPELTPFDLGGRQSPRRSR
ncbi:MAG TPA: hypothetical protein VFU31_30615 [Candidatus Binatia bacterium]|nr:hypothetical protein [Candidatus Binatia bacterium]